MGLLDFLFDSEKAEERKLQKLRDTITNMYVQESERRHAIRQLAGMETEAAIETLMDRFGETCHNSTVDIDEKKLTYDLLVEVGEQTDLDVAGIVRQYLVETEEKINWPLKVLKDLLSYEEMVELVIELLDTCQKGYERNPEKKQELMLQSTELRDEELAERLLRFLEDANETIRFLAVDAVVHQDYDEIIEEPLRERLAEEDSLRVVKKIADIFSEHKDWKIPEDEQAAVEQALPDDFGIHKEGHIYRRRI